MIFKFHIICTIKIKRRKHISLKLIRAFSWILSLCGVEYKWNGSGGGKHQGDTYHGELLFPYLHGLHRYTNICVVNLPHICWMWGHYSDDRQNLFFCFRNFGDNSVQASAQSDFWKSIFSLSRRWVLRGRNP